MEENQGQSNKSGMWKIAALFIATVILVGGIYYVSAHAKKTVHATQPTPTTPSAVAKQKVQDADFAQFSYKIFPGSLTLDAQRAITGFDLQTKPLADGATQVVLTAKKQGYITQTLTAKKDQSVYFIERTLGDDHADTDEDNTFRDDHAIIVDKDGYIIQQ